jgi:electron transfer flavoprotein beta subunit
MNIVVCVKQVPENLSIGLDRDTGYVRRSEAKGTVNQADRHALELGLQLKAAAGGNLIALSMGPSGADQALRQALAMGYDEAYLVTDPALAGSDTGATASVLAAAIGKLTDVGLVLTGEFSADGATAHTAPRLAEALGLPFVSSVVTTTLDAGTLKAERNGDARREQVEAPTPALASVSLDSPKPRIPNAMGVMKAAKKPLTTWSLADLGLESANAGQEGSCTWVTRSFKPEKREKGETLKGDATEVAQGLFERLSRKNLVEV